MTIKKLEAGYYIDEDVQDKLSDIVEALNVSPNNEVLSAYDAEDGNDHYILVEILAEIVDRLP